MPHHYCTRLVQICPEQYSPCTRQGVVLVHGARIGFFQGDIRSLSDDLCALKPTVFAVVPRLLNRMYDRVGQSSVQSRDGKTRYKEVMGVSAYVLSILGEALMPFAVFVNGLIKEGVNR